MLIFEDEAIISMDLGSILLMMGHEVTGIACTWDAAGKMGCQQKPGLILADIQLVDNSSGIDAVKTLLPEHDVPVIFITAFAERFLTDARPEPTFVIAKPYDLDEVVAAFSLAMLFASTEMLHARWERRILPREALMWGFLPPGLGDSDADRVRSIQTAFSQKAARLVARSAVTGS